MSPLADHLAGSNGLKFFGDTQGWPGGVLGNNSMFLFLQHENLCVHCAMYSNVHYTVKCTRTFNKLVDFFLLRRNLTQLLLMRKALLKDLLTNLSLRMVLYLNLVQRYIMRFALRQLMIMNQMQRWKRKMRKEQIKYFFGL